MTAAAPAQAFAEPPVDLLTVFAERASARAFLWAIGEFDMPEAVDPLQHDATRDGLVRRIGQDAVQAMLANAFAAFAPYREGAP
jgi:hypothetical protein